MTNESPASDESPPAGFLQVYEERGAVVIAFGIALGVLRAVAIVAAGPAAIASWIEGAYAFFLYFGVAYFASLPVRALGAWLDMIECRAATTFEPREPAAAPAEPPAAAPPLDPREWRERIEAARGAGDAAGVLELRERPPEDLDEPALKELDADLAKWFLATVHRRLRSGPLRADLVALADRGAEAFARTKEGASLRAALPTLRRGAGLCPRCAKPYAGVWEACPECMGRPEPPPPEIPGLPAADVDDVAGPPSADGRWFVDPDVEGRPGP